ncbi:MAG: hypothetical protein J6Y08_10630 [Clostridiales bacterium]|nr:hypothetical protein [Clostridiales bacterium]
MSKKNLLAVIDLGSLSLRLKIFELGDKNVPKEIESVRKYLSLVSNTYTEGVISQSQAGELLSVLGGFAQKIREYRIKDVICVATSAFREASNRAMVIEQIRVQTGLQVTVLDNAMERYFHNLAVKESQPGFAELVQAGTMVLDIGSGSMQATLYDKSDLVFSQNTRLGSLRISELLSDLAKQTTHYTEVLEEYISQDLAEYHAIEPKNIQYKNLIVFGSDIGFIKALAGESPREYCYLSKEKFDDVVNALLRIRPEDLARKLDITPATAPLLLPTALMVKKMLDYTGIDGVHMPDASLTEGVMYDYAWSHKHYDLVLDPERDLISAARHVAKRYKSEKKHIVFVEEAAMAVFDATKKLHGMNARARTLLRIAALCHELGKFINISNPSPSTYSIIDRTELIGLSDQERKIVAMVGRFYVDPIFYQDPRYAELPTKDQVLVSKLTAILRLADALDASHKQKLRQINVAYNSEGLVISGDTMYDMTYDKWFFESHTDLFTQFFSVKAILRVRRQIR